MKKLLLLEVELWVQLLQRQPAKGDPSEVVITDVVTKDRN